MISLGNQTIIDGVEIDGVAAIADDSDASDDSDAGIGAGNGRKTSSVGATSTVRCFFVVGYSSDELVVVAIRCVNINAVEMRHIRMYTSEIIRGRAHIQTTLAIQ